MKVKNPNPIIALKDNVIKAKMNGITGNGNQPIKPSQLLGG